MTDTRCNFSDEILSSFLDGELPAMEMAAVRAALEQDLSLADRLATLALADKLVRQHAQALDNQPLPAALVALLAGERGVHSTALSAARPAAPPARRILAGRWPQWRQYTRPLAMAASVVVVLSLALSYLNRPTPALPIPGVPDVAEFAMQLDSAPSGSAVELGATTLLMRFTFRNRNEQYCRLYQVVTPGTASEQIACRQEDTWALLASVQLPAPADADNYVPASSVAIELDTLLNTIMPGPALDLAAEAAMIRQGWQPAAND